MHMDIPIAGLMIDSDDPNSDSGHSHHLYITSWNGRPVHNHHFSGMTSFNAGHDHQYAGITAPAPTGVPHTHRYFTVTSFDDGHEHEIQGVTGPAIPLPDGRHYHTFQGVTTVNGSHPHSHRYSGNTSV
jgi:hypothetical protein